MIDKTPLTAEILKSFGFKRKKTQPKQILKVHSVLYIVAYNFNGDEWVCYITIRDKKRNYYAFITDASYRFLHELCNLYFVLTGETLKNEKANTKIKGE